MGGRPPRVSSSAGRVLSLLRHSALVLVALAVGLGAAGPTESASRRCARELDAGHYREAREACAQGYFVDGDPADLVLLARAELQLGNDDEARRLAERGLDGPSRGESLALVGVVLDRAGERDRAREKLYEAIGILREQGNERELSRSFFALAGSFWRDRLLGKTLDALDSAMVAARRAGDRRLKGLIELMRGDVMRSIGDARSAERAYEVAAEELQGRPADLAYVDLKQGILRQEAGLLNLADISFRRALARAEETGSRDAIAAAHQNLAYNAHLLGNTSEGFAQLADWNGPLDFSHYSVRAMLEADSGRLDDALASMDVALSLSRSNDTWWGEFERGRILERLGDDAAAEAGYGRAIEIVERMRASMDQSELQAWMIPRRRKPYEALLALLVREGRTREALRVLEAFSARSFIDALVAHGALDEVRGDASDLLSAGQRLQGLAGPDDLADALAHREVLVPIEVLGRLVVVFKPVEGEVRFVDRGSASDVRELASRFTADPDAVEVAEDLGRILIPEEVASGKGTLHVVASDWLATIPYPALRIGGGFLIERRDLAAMPSLRAFSQHDGRRASGGRLVLADADGTLPSARGEAREIAERLGAPLWAGEDATSARIESAGPLELLHIGTHAGLEGGTAWLAMADGRWSTDAILDSGVCAGVVVLAACASAATHHEEVWGSLAVAFLANGSGSVIASLGAIDDEETRSIMRLLYRADVGRHPVGALASAQRSVAGTMPPHAWAKFVVYSAGDD